MAAAGIPATPTHNMQTHAIARLEKGQDDMLRLMKSLVTQMQQISTRDKVFQKSFLHMTRKEQSANTAPLIALDDLSRAVSPGQGGKGREPVYSYAAGQSRQNRHKDGYDRLNIMEPI
eukprot:1247199-Pleurochrysis_carterae.AAC.1